MNLILSQLLAAINATTLTSVAMKEGDSDVVEVRLGSGDSGLEVLRNQKTLSFTEQSWMDLQGETLIHLSANNKVIHITVT